MNNLIIAGLIGEGVTDMRFLESVVKRTLDDVAFDAKGQIETELVLIEIDKKDKNFVEQILEASKLGIEKYGVKILFVHTDADDLSDETVFNSKINPAKTALENAEGDFCKTMVAVVPVQMTESWMLADKTLLKSEIGTEKSNEELGINHDPESFSDPKKIINNAIRISRTHLTRRRRKKGIQIGELYQIIGSKVQLERLETVPSFEKFKLELRNAFIEMNLI